MKHNNIISIILTTVSFLMTATEMEEIKTQYNNSTIHISEYNPSLHMQMGEDKPKKQDIKKEYCPYTCCPKPYKSRKCEDTRVVVTTTSFGIFAIIGFVKIIEFSAKMCSRYNGSCEEACRFTWGPTGNDACDSTADGCLSALSWGGTGCMALNVVGCLCGWAPWWDKHGCNLCKRTDKE